jgi:amidase
MPAVDAVVDGWVPHCAVEAAVAHAATYPARRAEYGPVLSALLDTGLALGGPDYQRILLARAEFTARFDALMGGVDLLLTPVTPFAAPSVARIAALRNEPGYRQRLSRFTAPFDMSGHPTLTLPAGFTGDGLPVAVQLVAGRLREDALVHAGRVFQAITDWHTRRPPV